MITVLLADDHELMRKTISNLLRTDPEIDLIGVAASLEETIELAGRLTPHVIVLDVHLSDQQSMTTSEIKSSFAGARVIAMSLANDADTQSLADDFGAEILLDKMALAEDLIPAIKHQTD